MKIGIISDTHGYLSPVFSSLLAECDYIIHAGDIGTQKCYQTLKDLNIPLYMVRGNCDQGGWAAYLPETLSFRIAGHLFYLIHDRTQLGYPVPEADFLVSGHTHRYENQKFRDMTALNPGSASESRTSLPPSMMIMELNDGEQPVINRYFDGDAPFHF